MLLELGGVRTEGVFKDSVVPRKSSMYGMGR